MVDVIIEKVKNGLGQYKWFANHINTGYYSAWDSLGQALLNYKTSNPGWTIELAYYEGWEQDYMALDSSLFDSNFLSRLILPPTSLDLSHNRPIDLLDLAKSIVTN